MNMRKLYRAFVALTCLASFAWPVVAPLSAREVETLRRLLRKLAGVER